MKKISIFILVLFILVFLWVNLTRQEQRDIMVSPYPNGKNFAFSITDDPDHNKVFKIRGIYDFLDSIGVKTTIAVWMKDPERSNGIPDTTGQFYYGDTCENEKYLDFIEKLHKKGFEIALHTVSGGNDKRTVTIEGYETFKKIFGRYPKINIMHAENLENVYWGSKVVENKLIKRAVEYLYPKAKIPFSGEDSESPYFWGDVLQTKTKYVRLWGTEDINTLKFDPRMPYHDANTHYVNYWFSFSDGYSPAIFNKMLSNENIERLAKERGTCIVYTHFANGFTYKNSAGKRVVNEEFTKKMRSLSSYENGWFVPVSTILDRLLAMKNISVVVRNRTISIVNMNEFDVDGVTLLVEPSTEFVFENRIYKSNDEGEVVIDKLRAKENYSGEIDNETLLEKQSETRGLWEKYKIFYERAKLVLKHRY